MIDTLYIDDLDGAVTLFKATEEGTETIAVFDEEHREVIQDLLAEIKRLRSILGYIKGIEMDWGIDFNHASITVTHYTGLMLSGELKLEMMD